MYLHPARYLLLILGFLTLSSCQGQPGAAVVTDAAPLQRLAKDTTIRIDGYEVLIMQPADSVRGDLLLLPGWDFSNRKWCDSTEVCRQALAKGLRVVAPQMARSIYATKYFPESRADLKQHPTLTWLDSAIGRLMREMGIFSAGKNYVLGLSTGGRGVALICEKRPGLFHAAAALSGDFNQASMPKDNLSTLVYGPYTQYRSRWEKVDNPENAASFMKTPIYLGHGLRDRIVPPDQTRSFASTLQKLHPDMEVVLHLDSAAGHDFSYWRSELPAIWAFFSAY